MIQENHDMGRLASVAGAVIQANGRPEFEDGLRTADASIASALSPWSMLEPL